MAQEFTFELSGMDAETLIPQVSRALELRTELVSREKYPRLWSITDWLNSRAVADEQHRAGRRLMRTGAAMFTWLLGLFAMIPGLMEPAEPSLYITGAVCCAAGMLLLCLLKPRLLGVLSLVVGGFLCLASAVAPPMLGNMLWPGAITVLIGLAALLGSYKTRKNRYEKPAKVLLSGREEAPGAGELRLKLDGSGVEVSHRNEPVSKLMDCPELTLAVETDDLILLFTEKLVLPLQKADLMSGCLPELRAFLRERTKYVAT